jgi:hypothetical protein
MIRFSLIDFLSFMKGNVTRKMNGMVWVKQNYPMEILMKDNISMEKDMEQERIDFLMVLVI